MPAKAKGVYQDKSGRWYFKLDIGTDPLTGKRSQITKRGFRTAAEAGRERREVLGKVDAGQLSPTPAGLTVGELLDLYLDGIEADGVLSRKTCFDYRHYADDYVRPHLGLRRVRDVSPEVILAWQRKVLKEGGVKKGKPLSANTVRLARAPLSGAFKLAATTGMIGSNPMLRTPRPKAPRSIPRHWTPEQAREFLALMEGDRTWTLWAFLLGSGLRIGEVVSLRWGSVDLNRRHARVVDFVSTLGYELAPSTGKSRDAVRTIELDDGLVAVLRKQQFAQKAEELAASEWTPSELVFTKPTGGQYHPQFLSRMLASYTKELKLPRLTAHGLRHTSATLMLASGVAPKVAAERLGHADPTLFTNLYSHVTPTMQREAADRIGSLLFGEDVSEVDS